jgi:hypothetical protein
VQSKKRFIGPISKSLLENGANAVILLVSLGEKAWISCPIGDRKGNPSFAWWTKL